VSFSACGVPRTQALLRRWTGRGKSVTLEGSATDLIRRARRAQRITRNSTGLGGNCLVRSLVLWTMLLRRGLATDLRVGFRNRQGKIEGHAWIEHDGIPVNEAVSETQTYVPYEQPVSFDFLRSHL